MILIIVLVGCKKDFLLVNNSNEKFVSKDHFENCILTTDYSELIPKVKYSGDQVKFEYIPALDTSSCEGIYYYRLVSRSFRQPVYRNKNGQTYSRYYLFILIDDRVYSTLNMTEKERKKFFDLNEERLKRKFGDVSISNLEKYIIDGYKDFY